MMTTTQEPQMLFYQNLGELFYAVAASDKVVRQEEYNALKKIVIDHWKDFEDAQDEFQQPAIYQMEIVFEWFDYEHMDAQDCFESFSDYAMEHPNAFTEEKIGLIVKTANAIAAAFSGKNKSELIMLGKLNLLFNKIKTK